jgi:hypothetical protein
LEKDRHAKSSRLQPPEEIVAKLVALSMCLRRASQPWRDHFLFHDVGVISELSSYQLPHVGMHAMVARNALSDNDKPLAELLLFPIERSLKLSTEERRQFAPVAL